MEDEIGLALAAPADGWQHRPDMHPQGTRGYRAAVVARTRFVEDLVLVHGIRQYVLLGAGLDTFAQRHGDRADVRVFEVDQPGPQAWKRQRLEQLGYGIPDQLRFVPVDFEAGDDWWAAMVDAGFDATEPAVAFSSGVSMYITKAATEATLQRLAAGLAPGSTVAMTFMLPFDLVPEAERAGLEGAARGARAAGTPWISFFAPDEIVTMARDAGFPDVRHVPTEELASLYLADRRDGLTAAAGEGTLLAAT
jgi:methyltransferase (TIGR00027 family)